MWFSRKKIDNRYGLYSEAIGKKKKSKEQNSPLCIAFIDISKAFDSVDRNMLFTILPKVNCPPNMLEILKVCYDNTSSTVKVEDTKSPSFKIKTGVRQGCVLAPLLFIFLHAGHHPKHHKPKCWRNRPKLSIGHKYD